MNIDSFYKFLIIFFPLKPKKINKIYNPYYFDNKSKVTLHIGLTKYIKLKKLAKFSRTFFIRHLASFPFLCSSSELIKS